LDKLTNIGGWVIYISVAWYALGGILNIRRAAQRGGNITQMGLFQWGLAVGCLLAFPWAGWNKLHLLWVIPAGFVLSWTPIGRLIGTVIGHLTAIVFGGPSSNTD